MSTARARWGIGAIGVPVPVLVLVLVLVAALGASSLRVRLFEGNLHVVVPGEVLRSAQPEPEELDRLIASHGLRSVVFLRGAHNTARIEVERAIAEGHGARLHVLPLSARRLPSRQEVRGLIGLLETAERPLLLHCAKGTDRSGFAAALALLLEGAPLERARDEFGLRHGHLGPFSSSDLPIWLDLYADWLAAERAAHSPALLRRFAHESYTPYFYAAGIEALAFPSEVVVDRDTPLRFRVANRSPEPWPSTGTGRSVRLGVRIAPLEPSGARGAETALELRGATPDRVVRPGESVVVEAVLPALVRPGTYRVTVDMVDENVAWFAEMGSAPLERTLRAVARPPGRARP